jgi:hypothetical protein
MRIIIAQSAVFSLSLPIFSTFLVKRRRPPRPGRPARSGDHGSAGESVTVIVKATGLPPDRDNSFGISTPLTGWSNHVTGLSRGRADSPGT